MIRAIRLSRRPLVTQEDLSGRLAALGVTITRTGIAKIELGERYVLDYEAVAIAKCLRVNLEQLFARPL